LAGKEHVRVVSDRAESQERQSLDLVDEHEEKERR